MLTLLVSEDKEPLALFAQVDRDTVRNCAEIIDRLFREWCDAGKGIDGLEQWLCEKVAIEYKGYMVGWEDVLCALIEARGGRHVDYVSVCGVPNWRRPRPKRQWLTY